LPPEEVSADKTLKPATRIASMPNLRFALVLAAAAALCGAGKALAATDFPTVVRQILDSQTDGPLSQMSAKKRRAMTDCVVASLEPLPRGKKRFIVEGANFEQQEHRFGQVVDEDNAKWRQNIARACAEIAVEEDGAFGAADD
jgi:hypothetical protein